MGRLREVFARAREGEKRAALVIYLCAGDPDLDDDARTARRRGRGRRRRDRARHAVQRSHRGRPGHPARQRARAALGHHAQACSNACARFARASRRTPIVLFGYYNPLLAFGEQAVAKAAAEAGVDGFLVVDLPPEEGGSMLRGARAERTRLRAAGRPDHAK